MESPTALETSNKPVMMSLFESVTAFQPKMWPLRPQFLVEYQNMPKGQNKDRAFESIQKADSYNEYLDQKWKCQVHNRSALLWLLDYRENQNMKDCEKIPIENKINQFLKVMWDQEDIFPALRLNYELLGVRFDDGFRDPDWNDKDDENLKQFNPQKVRNAE